MPFQWTDDEAYKGIIYMKDYNLNVFFLANSGYYNQTKFCAQ